MELEEFRQLYFDSRKISFRPPVEDDMEMKRFYDMLDRRIETLTREDALGFMNIYDEGMRVGRLAGSPLGLGVFS